MAEGLSPGGLKESVEGSEEAVGLAGLRLGDDALQVRQLILAMAFMGSTLGQVTLMRHCLSILRTTLTCFRRRISQSCSRQRQARGGGGRLPSALTSRALGRFSETPLMKAGDISVDAEAMASVSGAATSSARTG